MCGIAGIVSHLEKLRKEDCQNFIDSLYHRGPDGRGVYLDSNQRTFLGHRRLKILDLSEAGDQPMKSGDGRYVIVFNGEIYNFLELREELSKKGHKFKSQSDTEVILAAYDEWKEECQYKFNGMWAFAIWDLKERNLFLSRDRFGVKPLYIVHTDEIFAFASEIKAFTNLTQIRFEFDDQSLADTIENPLCIEPMSKTIFRGIQKIPAGCCMNYKSDNSYSIRRWWNTLSHIEHSTESEATQIEKFKNLFFDACSIRMRSDVSIGTALSGGLDSSSILSTIFNISQKSHVRWPGSWQKSFTAAFPNSSHDELEFAKIASKNVNAEASFFTISAHDSIEHLEEVLYTIEDVFDPPVGPWLLYKQYRKQGVTISIDGHGADELLCGYHHQFEKALLQTLLPIPRLKQFKELWPKMKSMYSLNTDRRSVNLLSNLLKSGFQSLISNKNSKIYQFLKRAYWGQYMNSNGYGRYGWLRLNPTNLNPELESTLQSQEFKQLSSINQHLYLDFHFQTLPTILRNFDRCSMAHGIEIRAPFMDWRIVKYAFSLPLSAKIGDLGSKQILRKAMKGILPEEIRLRKSKIGFASPINQWIAGPLKNYIFDTIHSQSFQESTIWNGPAIKRDFDRYIRLNEIHSLRRVWEFILADRLISKFKSKRGLPQSKEPKNETVNQAFGKVS